MSLVSLISLACAEGPTTPNGDTRTLNEAQPELSTISLSSASGSPAAASPTGTVNAPVSPDMRRDAAKIDSALYAIRLGEPGTSSLTPPSTLRDRFSNLSIVRGIDGRASMIKLDEVNGRQLTLSVTWQAGALAHVTLASEQPNARSFRAEFSDAPAPATAAGDSPISAMMAQDSCLGAIGMYDLSVVLYGAALAETVLEPENPFAWAGLISASAEVDIAMANMNKECGC